MQILSKQQFRPLEKLSRKPLRTWHALVEKAEWPTPNDIKSQFADHVDLVADNRVIFDIGGSTFPLIVHVSTTFRRVLVTFVGTHAEVGRINPETV